jgi:hypothetical protein
MPSYGFASMKLPALLAALLATAALVRADIVVVQRIDGGGQSGEQTIRVKGDKARCDIGGAVSVIVDRQSGESITLSHAQKGYLTVSPEAGRAMIERMQKVRGSLEAPALVATGKKEKVGDHACEIYTAEVGSVKLTYWLAKDYPNFQTYLTQLDVLESAPLASARGGLAPRTKDLPGMPIKMLMEMSGQKVTIGLLSAKEENADPAIFKVPAGYKEMPAPPASPAP